MKRTFIIKLDTEFTMDFTHYGLTDAEQRGGYAAKKMVLSNYVSDCGVDEFEVALKSSISLFDAIAGVVKADLDYVLKHKEDFEINEEREGIIISY